MQPRDELAKGKRLGQIVVRAGIEPLDAVIDRVARREHQDRRADAPLSDRAAQINPLPPGSITSRMMMSNAPRIARDDRWTALLHGRRPSRAR